MRKLGSGAESGPRDPAVSYAGDVLPATMQIRLVTTLPKSKVAYLPYLTQLNVVALKPVQLVFPI